MIEELFAKTATLARVGHYYTHFGITPGLASLYGDSPDQIRVVEFRVSVNQDPLVELPGYDYWVWYDDTPERRGFSNMLWHARFLLDICFPGGIEGAERAGKGKAYRVEIVRVGGNKAPAAGVSSS